MSAVHRQSVEWWEDDERTQAVPLHQLAGARAGGPALPVLPDVSRVIVTGAVVAILSLLLYLGITGLIGWLRLKLDDMHYGRPRTFQTSAYVGHGESPGNPSHFVAMNLNRRVTVIEFPG